MQEAFRGDSQSVPIIDFIVFIFFTFHFMQFNILRSSQVCFLNLSKLNKLEKYQTNSFFNLELGKQIYFYTEYKFETVLFLVTRITLCRIKKMKRLNCRKYTLMTANHIFRQLIFTSDQLLLKSTLFSLLQKFIITKLTMKLKCMFVCMFRNNIVIYKILFFFIYFPYQLIKQLNL